MLANLLRALCSHILSYSLGRSKLRTCVLVLRGIISHSHADTRRCASPDRSGTSSPRALQKAMACSVALSTARDPWEVTKEDQASMPCSRATIPLVYFERGLYSSASPIFMSR